MLQILSIGGSRPPDKEEGWGGGVSKNISQPFWPHFGPKIKGGALSPSPGSASAIREMFNPLFHHSSCIQVHVSIESQKNLLAT